MTGLLTTGEDVDVADERAPGNVIELTDMVEEGVPLDSLGEEQLEANINELFSTDPAEMSGDLLSQEENGLSGMDQEDAELAALLKEVSEPAQEEGDGPDKGSSQGEDDNLDELLAGVAGSGENDNSPPPESGGGGDAQAEDDLEALLSEVSQTDPDQENNQEDSKATDKGPEDQNPEAPLAQDDLEALLAEVDADSGEEGSPGAAKEAVVDQSALDDLLKGEESAPSEAEASAGDSLAQDDLDALLEGIDAPPAGKEAAPTAGSDSGGSGALEQSDLDDLLQGLDEDLGQDKETAQPESEAPAPVPSEEAQAPEAEPQGNKALDQTDLDDLLSGLDEASAEAGAGDRPDPEEDSGGEGPETQTPAANLAEKDDLAAPDQVETQGSPLPDQESADLLRDGRIGEAAAIQGLDPDQVESILEKVARQVFEQVARELIPKVTEEVLVREIAALRRELGEAPD